MSTLIHELEQAAAGYEVLAKAPPGELIDAVACRDLAARLRKRVKRIKELRSALPGCTTDALDAGKALMFTALTGDL